MTISDCPCTITHSQMPYGTGVAAASGYLPANSTTATAKKISSSTILTSYTTSAESSSQSHGATSAATSAARNTVASAASPTQTGAAAHVGASFAGLVIAAGVAVLAL